MRGNKSGVNTTAEQRDTVLIEKARPLRSYRIKVIGFEYRTVSITTKLRRCISTPRDPSLLHTSFRQMPSSRYRLSLRARLLLIPQAIGDGLFSRRRKETMTTTKSGGGKRKARGAPEKSKEVEGEKVALFPDGFERESILGSEARFLSDAERNPLLPPSYFEWAPSHRLSRSREIERRRRIMFA